MRELAHNNREDSHASSFSHEFERPVQIFKMFLSYLSFSYFSYSQILSEKQDDYSGGFFSKQDNRNAIPVKISNVKMTIFRLSTSCLLFLFLCRYYLLKLMIFCSRSPQHPLLQLASFVPRCPSLPDKDQVFPFSAAGERPQ